ncbi:hypothetical protein Ait01nite_021900 [Actinoplanes italicus]|uniref:Uncharacterized protein n=1 Tax=Actinoplanes italicus TaxID=113567 RepID=A0A2T0KNU6_9ACTN|nr:hypothetical protein [Actinoplanes italicus]PRX25414.1 hypothetical protein CLV67_101127 [Actinoplanes italicus]GIE29145.1 hypothetical protein Ait01nite_021900 [Actinoplanes italicus]
MERGPLALFGAIIAVGLGPALWLGAQLGAVNLAPGQRPGTVDEQFPGADMDFGGAGAGDLADDGPVITYSYSPPTETSPVPKLVATSRPSPARTVPPRPPASPSRSPSVSPSASTSSSPPEDPPTGPSTSDSASPSASTGPATTEEGES